MGLRQRAESTDGVLDAHATRLARAPMSALADEVLALLEAAGRRARADRVTLWDPRWGERRLVLLHHWSRHGEPPPVTSLAPEDVPWLLHALREGRRVVFRSIASLPREAVRERKLFARHGPRSAALVPIVVGGTVVAVLVVGAMKAERAFGATTLALLDRVGVVVATALVRRRAHDASLAREGHLGGILEAAQDALLLVRPSGDVERANGRAVALFRRTGEELRASRLQDLLAAPPRAAAPALGTIEALLVSESPVALGARRVDGSIVPVEVTMRELRTPGDALFCCAIRDVTDIRRAREESALLRDEIALMGRAATLAEMGSAIAHELNQPLTAILSNAEAAQRLLRAGGAASDELGETLRDVVADTRRAAQVLDRMRGMLRRSDPARVPIDAARLLEGVARRFREEAVARSVRLSVDCAPGLPAVVGDPVQLEQVAANLVLNALEAMADGTSGPRSIAIRARPAEPGGIDVAVRDSGPGLSDEALAHLFDAFYTTKPSGLGMGLRISRWIVESHGGRLLARNNTDRGATFEFHLPAGDAEGDAARRRPA